MEGLEGVVYGVRPLIPVFGVNLPSGTQNIVFATSKLETLSSNCNPNTATHTGIGTLYKSPATIDSLAAAQIKEVGGNSYYFTGPQSACSDTSWQEESKAKDMLRESLKSLETAKK